MSPLSVPNFSSIRARIRVYGGFCEVCEMKKMKKKKTKKLKRKFVRSYLGNGWSDFLQIWWVVSPNWPALL